jgi:pimeloyl-ACP methyl ester carboxylesterase
MHGLGGSLRWWAKNIRPLAQRFRVYALDLMGFGKNRGPFALRQASEQVFRCMDRLGLSRASLVGHSMGGLIAAEMAADFPKRVDKLVLVDAAFMCLINNRARHWAGVFRGLPRFRPHLLSLMLFDTFRAGIRTVWKAGQELFQMDLRSKLSLIRTPTLLLWGEQDAVTPLSMGHGLCRLLPKARLISFPKTGHNVMWDQPEKFNQTVADFLSEGSAEDAPRYNEILASTINGR